jgi:DNA-binding HxlR family transcriptional regulator
MAMGDSAGRKHHITEEALPTEREAPAPCPAGQAIDLIAHKWTIHILFALHEAGGPVRFRMLQRAVEPITQKELTKRLRELERAGMVGRRVYAEVPPRVEYRLTELGSSLLPSLVGLHEWAEQHGATVEENRSRHEGSRAGT